MLGLFSAPTTASPRIEYDSLPLLVKFADRPSFARAGTSSSLALVSKAYQRRSFSTAPPRSARVVDEAAQSFLTGPRWEAAVKVWLVLPSLHGS